MKQPDQHFWNEKYLNNETKWDIGYASPSIIHFIEKIHDKSIAILIPGCGNSYEGEYLFNKGYRNIHLLDCSDIAKKNFLERVPDFPEDQFILGDFFSHEGEYDVIIEQTFFCAIARDKRMEYAKKMHHLLSEEGIIIGLLFDDILYDEHPPFGGSKEEYETYFSPYFSEITMEKCYNSIPEREGRELFIILNK